MNKRLWTLAAAVSFQIVVPVAAHAQADRDNRSAIPDGFVYLRDVAPGILQDMRYFGSHNFVGRRITGYEAGECILTREAATALSDVQRRLERQKLSLKVYDCYRPVRAVADFVAWSKRPRDQATKDEFYPELEKRRLFSLGYIARRSGHSRGSTVDLAIVRLPASAEPAYDPATQTACHLSAAKRFADNSLDFGTGYDCFHGRSHTASREIGADARRNRDLLVDEMAASGFANYRREWWHFSLKSEPYPNTVFDFPIRARDEE